MNIIADNGYVTEILEPGPTIREEWLTELLNRYEWLAEEAEAVVLSGSAAPGVPEDIYARLIRIASDKGKKEMCIRDSCYPGRADLYCSFWRGRERSWVCVQH